MSAFVDERRDRFGVEPICRTLGVSASAYYKRATGERSERSVEDERLIARIREVHEQNFECYRYPRVWRELERQGEQVGRDRGENDLAVRSRGGGMERHWFFSLMHERPPAARRC